MTLSLLMSALMITTLVVLAGVLAVDAVRGLSRASVRRAGHADDRAGARSASPGARSRRAAHTPSPQR